MRLYTFGNMYLSSIQQGIQSAHCQMELFLKYRKLNVQDTILIAQENTKRDTLYDWAENHKTMICLNGGFESDLKDIKTLFESSDNPYPWAHFNEAEDSMGGMLTNVAIVLPEELYMQSQRLRNKETILFNNEEFVYTEDFYANGQPISDVVYEFSDYAMELIELIRTHKFAI